jgi:hypothetical protein
MCVSRAAAFVAGHDAPPIGEPAATRGRSTTEGGGEQLAIARRYQRHYPFTAEPSCPRKLDERFRVRTPPPSSPRNATPLIGENAAPRGRSATKGGDERAGVGQRRGRSSWRS